MSTDVVLVGTAKGAFVISRSNGSAELSGPYLPGEQVYSVAIDTRDGSPRFLAGGTSEHWGSAVRASENLGETWTDPEVGNIKFPHGTGAAVEHIWQLQPAGPSEPDVVYAGVEPAALFRSEDGGSSFELVRGLWDHPHRPSWEPGYGGLCLHSIVVNARTPERLLIAISAAGVYRTDDGGRSWTAANAGIHKPNEPENFPEFGQCVHRVAADAADPDALVLQNHGGVYRSDDFGATWQDIASGLPSDFGFPIVTHPRRGGVAYVIPLVADEYRWVVDAKCRVFRTTDSGKSWAPLSSGLPQAHTYLTVLRDAFCSDRGDPAGLYFGTRSGEVYGSGDDGETWRLLASRLPPVLSVRATAVE